MKHDTNESFEKLEGGKIIRFVIWLTAVAAAIPCAAFVVLASAWLVGAV